MKKLKDMISKLKQNHEIHKLEKEEKKFDKEIINNTKELNITSGSTSNVSLSQEQNLNIDEPKKFTHTITSPLSSINSNKDSTGEKTLVLDVTKKEIRNIKKCNNKKRKPDQYKDLKNTNDYLIQVQDVSKIYILGNNKASQILLNVNLEIKRGDFVVLFGKSGSGKSTLLNIMSGLDRPTSGNVIVENTNLPYLTSHQLTIFRRNYIAFIFQQYHLLNNVTGYENVQTGAILNKKKNSIDIEKLFKEFELNDVMHKYPHQMSGGQQQRISIMRALSKNADIIFADEPTGALDKKTGIIVMEMLKRINIEENKTIIMVSHDPEVAKYAKRTIFLNKGKIISDNNNF